MADVNEKIAGVNTIDASSITSGTIDAARMYVAIDTYANIVAGYPAATYSGCKAKASDIGLYGTEIVSNGTSYVPVNGVATLYSSLYPYSPAPSGTISTGSSSHLTLGTTYPLNYNEGAWLYLPSIATTPAITAGWYYVGFVSGGNVCTIYTDGPGSAAYNFSGGAAYTGVTTQIASPTLFTFKGGFLQAGARVDCATSVQCTNNANAKYIQPFVASAGLATGIMNSKSGGAYRDWLFKVRTSGSGVQLYNSGFMATPTSTPSQMAANFSADLDFTVNFTRANATDILILTSIDLQMSI